MVKYENKNYSDLLWKSWSQLNLFILFNSKKWLSLRETPTKRDTKWKNLLKETDGTRITRKIIMCSSNMREDRTQSSRIWRPSGALGNPIAGTTPSLAKLATKMPFEKSNTIKLKRWRSWGRSTRFWEIFPSRINFSNIATWRDKAIHCIIAKQGERVLQWLLLRSQATKGKDQQKIFQGIRKS